MLTYRLLKALGRLALRWFYRDIEVVGIEQLPHDGPVLLASNHPNALVDALVICCTLRRPVTLTAKATLLENPATRALMRLTGVVPLRRASDEAARGRDASVLDPSRNANAFSAVLDVLQAGGVVLLFPEGKSHSDPALAPLRTGLARMALLARDERHIESLPIIPVGLTFERKWEPRSRAVMYVGSPVTVPADVPNDTGGVDALTERVDTALREVTLNFRSEDDAYRILSMSRVLAEVMDEFRPLHAPDPPLAASVRLAQHINAIASRLPSLDSGLSRRVEGFLARFTAFEHETRRLGVSAGDVQMSTDVGPGLWFVVRETLIAAVAGPLALWGRVNHWVPLRLARHFARRTSRTPDEPAMHTIAAGAILVLAFYVAQTALVAWSAGWVVAALYAATLPVSATWDFRYADRRRRGVARVRAYLAFRREPATRQRLLADLNWLRNEARALESLLDPAGPTGQRVEGLPLPAC